MVAPIKSPHAQRNEHQRVGRQLLPGAVHGAHQSKHQHQNRQQCLSVILFQQRTDSRIQRPGIVHDCKEGTGDQDGKADVRSCRKAFDRSHENIPQADRRCSCIFNNVAVRVKRCVVMNNSFSGFACGNNRCWDKPGQNRHQNQHDKQQNHRAGHLEFPFILTHYLHHSFP